MDLVSEEQNVAHAARVKDPLERRKKELDLQERRLKARAKELREEERRLLALATELEEKRKALEELHAQVSSVLERWPTLGIEEISVLEKNLSEMGLGRRTYWRLYRYGAETIGDVVRLAKDGRLLMINRIGKTTMTEILQRIYELTGEDYSMQNGLPKMF